MSFGFRRGSKSCHRYIRIVPGWLLEQQKIFDLISSMQTGQEISSSKRRVVVADSSRTPSDTSLSESFKYSVTLRSSSMAVIWGRVNEVLNTALFIQSREPLVFKSFFNVKSIVVKNVRDVIYGRPIRILKNQLNRRRVRLTGFDSTLGTFSSFTPNLVFQIITNTVVWMPLFEPIVPT